MLVFGWDLIGQSTAEAPIATDIALHRLPKVTPIPIRPILLDEDQFGVGRLPKQEVGDSLLTGAPDEQVDVGDGRLIEVMPEALLGDPGGVQSSSRSLAGYRAGGVHDLGAATVVISARPP